MTLRVETMTDTLGERLSALMDGELSEAEAEPVLEALRQDNELQSRWERYQLIGDALRNHLPDYMSADLASQVSEALANEPALLVPQARRRALPLVLRPVAGLAVAASVAMVAILGLQLLRDNEASPVLGPVADAGRTTQPNLERPSVQTQLDRRYLVNHYEHAPTNGMKGMLPYATVVGYDTGR